MSCEFHFAQKGKEKKVHICNKRLNLSLLIHLLLVRFLKMERRFEMKGHFRAFGDVLTVFIMFADT